MEIFYTSITFLYRYIHHHSGKPIKKGGNAMKKQEEPKSPIFEVTDPKPPIIHAGPKDTRK